MGRSSSLGVAMGLEAGVLLGPAAGLGDLASPHLRGVVVGDLDHRQPAQVLLGLDERAISDDHGATGGIGAECVIDVLLQPTGKDIDARVLHLLDDLHGFGSPLPEPVLAVVADPLLVEVDEVLRHDASCSRGPDARLLPSTNGRAINRHDHGTARRDCRVEAAISRRAVRRWGSWEVGRWWATLDSNQ